MTFDPDVPRCEICDTVLAEDEVTEEWYCIPCEEAEELYGAEWIDEADYMTYTKDFY